MSQTIAPMELPCATPLPAGIVPKAKVLELADGYKTPVYIYVPPRGVELRRPVLYLHGIQSHPGWFCGSAAGLARLGYPIFQVTRRGSGENRDRYAHVPSAKRLLEDVAVAARWAMKAGHAERIHLLGVSWGGKVAAAFATRRWEGVELASLTMVAPGIATHVDVRKSKKLLIALMALLWPRKMFNIPLNNVNLFTDNEAMREYLRRDHYRLLRVTARTLYASGQLDFMLKHAREGCIHLPTTVILAARDRIVDNVRTRRIIIRLTAGHEVTDELDAAHTLEFEPSSRPFHAALANALERGELAKDARQVNADEIH